MKTIIQNTMLPAIVLLAAFGLAHPQTLPASEVDAIVPLIRAHSHNDYEHARPLQDALDQGFCSVEADIYLVEGRLLVAHNFSQVTPERTLEKLYLDPLRQRIQANGGRVFPGGPECTLLIDLKTEADGTYRVLRSVLGKYQEMLTRYENGRVITNALRVILSGNRPRKLMLEETSRLAAYDGRLEDLERKEGADFTPWISENWQTVFKWRGVGPLPSSDQEKLASILRRAHQQGRQVRFWGTLNQPAFWEVLYQNQVDILNADDLPGLRKFLTAKLPGK